MTTEDLKPHFLALLTYARTEDGGKKIPALSGDRPTVRFSSHNESFTAVQKFIDIEFAFAGDTLNAEITLLDAENLKGKIYEGLDFVFYEGVNPIGRGIIKKILDLEWL